MWSILSTAARIHLYLTKLDVNRFFPHIDQALRDVYFMPPHESAEKGLCVWILHTSAYGLINANKTSQVPSDSILTDMGFTNPLSYRMYSL